MDGIGDRNSWYLPLSATRGQGCPWVEVVSTEEGGLVGPGVKSRATRTSGLVSSVGEGDTGPEILLCEMGAEGIGMTRWGR